MPAIRIHPRRAIGERGRIAIGAVPKSHVLRLYSAGDEQHRMLEVKLGIWLPFPESLERLAEEFAILKTR